jgi:hypothetical protein
MMSLRVACHSVNHRDCGHRQVTSWVRLHSLRCPPHGQHGSWAAPVPVWGHSDNRDCVDKVGSCKCVRTLPHGLWGRDPEELRLWKTGTPGPGPWASAIGFRALHHTDCPDLCVNKSILNLPAGRGARARRKTCTSVSSPGPLWPCGERQLGPWCLHVAAWQASYQVSFSCDKRNRLVNSLSTNCYFWNPPVNFNLKLDGSGDLCLRPLERCG